MQTTGDSSDILQVLVILGSLLSAALLLYFSFRRARSQAASNRLIDEAARAARPDQLEEVLNLLRRLSGARSCLLGFFHDEGGAPQVRHLCSVGTDNSRKLQLVRYEGFLVTLRQKGRVLCRGNAASRFPEDSLLWELEADGIIAVTLPGEGSRPFLALFHAERFHSGSRLRRLLRRILEVLPVDAITGEHSIRPHENRESLQIKVSAGTPALLKQCAHCKRVLSEGRWIEAPATLRSSVSHGICSDCAPSLADTASR